MLSISQESNNLRLVANRTSNQVFDRVNPYTNRTEGITNLKELFLDSVKSRIKVCDIESYKIASDLSGGFDSRIVLGGLEKFNHDVTYCTQKLNTNDQRQISQTLFEALDSPGDFLSPSPEHDYDLKKIGEFIYDYDCLGNFSVGYNSMIVASTLKNHVDTKTVRFMGFGGEFLRHPLKEFRKSLFYGIAHDFYFYSNISLEEACLLAGFDYESYCQQLSNYFQSYPEKTHEGQLTRLYFEYYFRYVISAEDYCRKFQWTVSPLWGNMFMQAVLYRVPLTWTGFRFFTHLMKAINPRLLFTPIYGKRVNLNSEWSLALFEMKERLKVMIRMHTPIARNIYKKIQTRLIEPQSWHIIKSEIYDIKSSLIKRILPERPQILGEKNVIIARRYLTLLMYLREIEARYNGKINGPHENLS
jgi:hypothetical protein